MVAPVRSCSGRDDRVSTTSADVDAIAGAADTAVAVAGADAAVAVAVAGADAAVADAAVAVIVADAGAADVDADAGGVTVEAAMALAVLAVVLVACLAGVVCVIAQVRCADAAREAARLVGRGDADAAAAAVAALAPTGASLTIGGQGDLVQTTVVVQAIGGLLPGVTIRATASAAREPVS